MDEKQVSKAVFKKLSALRATLSDEEQALLDELLVGEHEVSAHLRVFGATATRTTNMNSEEDEVSAHRMSNAAVAARAATVSTDKDEAIAHRYSSAESRLALRVFLNNEKETYTVE